MRQALAFIPILSLLISCQASEIHPRILNGIPSNASSYPYFVFIENGATICGGIVLSDRWVLTAAHCLRGNVHLNIYFGIDANLHYHEMRMVYPMQQYTHPGYRMRENINDMGLMKLSSPVTLSEKIRAAKLPFDTGSAHPGNERVAAIGMGKSSMTQRDQTTSFRQASFTTMPSDECAEWLDKSEHIDAFICIDEDRETNRSTFHGDSGGPLFREEDGAVIGITSYGRRRYSDSAVVLQVFSDVVYFYDWIALVTELKLPAIAGINQIAQ